MSKKTVIVCDKCRSEAIHEFALFKDRHADAAGGMENDYFRFHLCQRCMANVLEQLFKDFSTQDAADLIKAQDIKAEVI